MTNRHPHNRTRYPSTLPAPDTVPLGTVIPGRVTGWRRREDRRIGPTWQQVFIESPTGRSVRKRLTRVIWALMFTYLGFGAGWMFARPGEPVTQFDINLVTYGTAALVVAIAADILNRFCVLPPAPPAEGQS